MKTLMFAFLFAAAASVSGHAAEQRVIHSQPSWVISTPQVELAITERGGQMAPVTFFRDTPKPVQPYHISPWQDEGLKNLPAPVLASLRGDWFCVPFGGNSDAFNGEQHPPHGEVAGGIWKLVGDSKADGVTTLKLAFETKVRAGKISKELSLVDGQNVVYSRDVIEGFAGPAPLGHHATLAMPDKEGVFRIATSPFRFGLTNPTLFSDPVKREYQSLAIGTRFTDLTKVPVLFRNQQDADITWLPARQGFADLLQIVNQGGGTAWTTATRTDEGWLWFSLKDPSVLNSTVFWIENRGRHGVPWNGRNNCLGLEDVTAYFADGLVASTQLNLLNKEGVPTAIELKVERPTAVNYIQGVARVPTDFDVVKSVEFKPGEVIFTSASGKSVTISVLHEFLKTGKL